MLEEYVLSVSGWPEDKLALVHAASLIVDFLIINSRPFREGDRWRIFVENAGFAIAF